MRMEYRSNGGLVLAEHAMDSAAIEHALKQKDPKLALQGWPSQTAGCVIWKVVRYAGPDRPPDTVCVWQTDRGQPLPLSSGLLDLVDRLDRNARGSALDDDALNQKVRDDAQRKLDDEVETVKQEHLRREQRKPYYSHGPNKRRRP